MDLPYSWCRYRLHRDIIDRPCPSSTGGSIQHGRRHPAAETSTKRFAWNDHRARDNNLYKALTKLWPLLQRNSNKYQETIK